MSETRASLPRRGFMARMAAALTGGAFLSGTSAPSAHAAEPLDPAYISEIRMFAGSTPPSGWMFCEGQLLDPNIYNALFSLIGTSYGGDGQNTFALPDLRGRTPVHPDGVFFSVPGQKGGWEETTLFGTQIPVHAHALAASAAAGTSDQPSGRVPARNAAGVPCYAATANTNLSANALGSAGGSQPHPNMQPWLGIHFMIAVEGIYPSPS